MRFKKTELMRAGFMLALAVGAILVFLALGD